MGAVWVLTTAGPLLSPSRGPQPRCVHCTAAGAILGRGSCGAVMANIGQNPLQSGGAAVPTRAGCPPITSLQFSRPPVIIMAGFMRRARFVARERHTMRAAPSAPSHAPRKSVTLIEIEQYSTHILCDIEGTLRVKLWDLVLKFLQKCLPLTHLESSSDAILGHLRPLVVKATKNTGEYSVREREVLYMALNGLSHLVPAYE
ncbi:hypothetical protein NDU88_003872 [Pleurodeles waltl]|uniref:Integrator complex subunit 9-like C-terminal domain-containing protein n=1 Tax=Pleurodeles waltl TaxID=8319 RepID=A0AAV7UE23_PLEWA|nr:hypothetical protein NDU88_003872 [Pleurodeles waltl]